MDDSGCGYALELKLLLQERNGRFVEVYYRRHTRKGHAQEEHYADYSAACHAVYDIDNDGREELLFSLSGTTYVWEYRDSVLYEELRAFTYGLIIKCKNACRDAAGIFNCILAVFTC